MRSRRRFNPLRFDPRSIKFFTLNQWSDQRPLDRARIVQVLGVHSGQTWCRDPDLELIRSQIADPGGPACSLIDLEIDHHESDYGRALRVTLAPSLYGDFIAASEYFSRNPESVDEVLDRLEREEVRDMIRAAPLSVIAVNVTITSADGFLLAIRRSASVRTSQNIWTLGPNETMNLPNLRPGESEDFFRLAERCLREEAGLEPVADYGPIYFSWMGYNVPGALVHLVAHVKANLDHVDVEERLHQSHGAFEADQIAWLRDSRRSLEDIVHNHSLDSQGRRWIDSAPLAAQQYWRMRASVVA